MAVARIDPLAVEAVELIIIMYTLIVAVVEGCIRDGEAVLVVAQTDLTATVEHRFDGASDGWAHQLVVDPQVGKHERRVPEGVDISRIEHRDAIGTAKDQTAIGQLAGGTIHELIASQTVGLVERGDAPRLHIQTVQTLHRTDPEVALTVFLNTADVRAREPCDTCHRVRLRTVAQQTVAHGADPHIAVGILIHIRRDEHAATDALLHVRYLECGQLTRLGVQSHDVLEESRDEHRAVAESLQRGDESIVDVKRLFGLGLTAPWTEAVDIGRTGCHPDSAIVRLLEVHRHRHRPLAEDVQP